MKSFRVYCSLAIGLFLLAYVNLAQAVSADALIDHAKGYDGQVISFKGEVIGDIMKRGEFAWINISDGVNTIGVWVPIELIDKIRFTGDYKHTGDYVEIEGAFHRACLEHAGELDIHAEELTVLRAGEMRTAVVSQTKQKTAIGFLGVALCLGILKALTERYKRI
jgi:hypothetical protein